MEFADHERQLLMPNARGERSICHEVVTMPRAKKHTAEETIPKLLSPARRRKAVKHVQDFLAVTACRSDGFQTFSKRSYVRSVYSGQAKIELAKTIYEALFYLGLAPVEDGEFSWKYKFAAALLYDGSPAGSMVQAWADMREEVRQAIWNTANIYVMLLRTSTYSPPRSAPQSNRIDVIRRRLSTAVAYH